MTDRTHKETTTECVSAGEFSQEALPAASVMGPKVRSSWRTQLLTFSALCLLLWPFWNGQSMPLTFTLSPQSRDKVVTITVETWKRCGSVALDPRDNKWSCCGPHYPFHRDSQRCCPSVSKKFFVIPKNSTKSEYEECKKYDLI